MFYLHFLALPMFLPLLLDLSAQLHLFNETGTRSELRLVIPFSCHAANITQGLQPHTLLQMPMSIFGSLVSMDQAGPFVVGLSIPQIYLLHALNTVMQLICASGVNRLTKGVSALTVTLVLVVRKPVSLIQIIGVFARVWSDMLYAHLPAEGPKGVALSGRVWGGC